MNTVEINRQFNKHTIICFQIFLLVVVIIGGTVISDAIASSQLPMREYLDNGMLYRAKDPKENKDSGGQMSMGRNENETNQRRVVGIRETN